LRSMRARCVWRTVVVVSGLALAGVLSVLCSTGATAGGVSPASAAVDAAVRDVVSDARDGRPVDATPACIRWTTEVRYRPYGYDHLVHIHSACERAASCRVSTDVNPDAITVRVPPRESVTVVTFQGSPARTFSAKVACALE
jgi:hypothetical protein